jgi:hypothetical protein
MARKTFPRRDQAHSVVANEILVRHARLTGQAIELPVPVDLIIEKTYGLEISWDVIEEPAGAMILGALHPGDRRIVLNERHSQMFDRWVGPERFTLAHELAHWVYDADDPNQLAFATEDPSGAKFCYHRESQGLADDGRIREVNANKLAAHLLLPEHLVRQASIDAVVADFRSTAARWGVSQQTLRIRLEDLGVIDNIDAWTLDGL